MTRKLLSLLIALALMCAAALAEDPFGQEAVEDEMYNVDAYAFIHDWIPEAAHTIQDGLF